MSSPSDRETRLNGLRMILGRELNEDLKKEGRILKDRFIRDFEQEILLAEAFASRQDPVETVYHRVMAETIHKTLRDLESMID
ncbi:MAG: hypothetical protein GEU26_18715 [Nitrososphaeraceae archaeon]|nr:hypothetical protein [Nitrososphaeraceae archaeon]